MPNFNFSFYCNTLICKKYTNHTIAREWPFLHILTEVGFCKLCQKIPHFPLQYSCLENPMDGGAWWAAVHGVAKSRTRLSNFTFTFHFLALEKEMATHSSVLGWRIPGTAEPRGLPSMGMCRVGHNWIDLAAAGSLNIFFHKRTGHLHFLLCELPIYMLLFVYFWGCFSFHC